MSNELPILAAGFVHPGLAAAGVALAGVPVIIHLLNRRRYRRVAWAAMGFLLSASKRNARRIRVEQLLLLAIRVLILLAAAWALARPFVQEQGLAAGLGQTRAQRILVIDDSLSMSMTDGQGTSVLDRARQAARRLLDRFAAGDEISVVLASRPATPVVRVPSHDRAQIEKLIDDLRPSQGATDLPGAVELVARIIKETASRPGRRDVYIITDGTRIGWAEPGGDEGALSAAFAALAERAALTIVDLGPRRRGNVAVQNLRCTTRVLGTTLPGTFLVDVVNHGRIEQRGLRLRVIRDGEVVATPAVPPVAPGKAQTVQFEVEFADPGGHRLTVELPEAKDVLRADNTCFLAVSVVERLNVLLVDGRPGIAAGSSATQYLRMALSPAVGSERDSLVNARVIAPAELADELLDDVAVVGLADVRDLGRKSWRRLEEFVSGGGGLVVFLGPQAEADLGSYNQLGYADGKGLLPVTLVRKVGLAAPASGEGGVRFASRGLDHPILRDFRAEGGEVLFLARIDQYVLARLAPQRPDARVVLSYTTGDPAIVTAAFGAGQVVLVTTSGDMTWTNLPAKPVFPVLCLQLVLYAAPDRWGHRNVETRQPLIEPLAVPESSLPLQIVPPEGPGRPARLLAEKGRFTARFDGTDRAGHYALRVGDSTRRFAVNLPAEESDLQPIDERSLRQRLGVPFEYLRQVEQVSSVALAAPAHEVGLVLLWGVLGLVLLETLLAQRFGHHD